MTRPSILPHFRTLRGIALLATAALLLLESSAVDATAAEPAEDSSISGQNEKAPNSERELVNIRGMMLASLKVLDPQFREAQAALKAAEAQAAREAAKARARRPLFRRTTTLARSGIGRRTLQVSEVISMPSWLPISSAWTLCTRHPHSTSGSMSWQCR